MFSFFRKPATLPSPADALPGRATPIRISGRHAVTGASIRAPWPEGTRTLVVGMGCFWGAEKAYWSVPGVIATAVGYAGGFTPNPTYDEVCSGQTGHAEVVLVAFDPARVAEEQLLRLFWEHHDPTQGMRQGNDVGTQYRSVILVADDAQRVTAERTRDAYQVELTAAGYGPITTQIAPLGDFFYAEEYHQQYLHKVPNGYCPDHGTGVACPVGLGVRA
ncbi:MAG: peptide-methionine (S)-S-oxide reductase MsrA [Chloroflexota bacterium]